MSWWAIEYPLPRTGRKQVTYTDAPNRQTAAQFAPGTTVLGGPYKTEADAEAAHPQGSSGSITPPAGVPPPTVNQQPTQLGGLAAIGAFFNALGQKETWLRVAEGVLGITLVIVAVDHLTGAKDKIIKLAKVAAK